MDSPVPPDDAEPLTVGQVSARLGVTVRSLHHWDRMRLVQPTARTSAGYRLYTASDRERLRRVLIYRQLGLGLDTIRNLLDNAAGDATTALRAQRAELETRIGHLQELAASLDRMIDAHGGNLPLTVEKQAELFGSGWDPGWPAQAHERYGATLQWRQYAERSASRSPDEWRRVATYTADVERALAEAMTAGVAPGSEEANALVERHREALSTYFPLTRQMQVCIGRKYETDPGFAAHFDGVRPGLAAWLRQLIDASARAHDIDPDTATWH